MYMQDSSFIDLTNINNLSKIKIDKELIPVFKTAMRNFQEYFNYMGYTSERNYQEFFKKYLTTNYGIRKLAIEFSDITKSMDCNGMYSFWKRKIIINQNCKDDSTNLLSIFMHEFIHFLVHHYVRDKRIDDESIIHIPFLNEALTEMLKMEILPYTYMSYVPLIKMLNLWLVINNKKVNYNDFLNYGRFYEIDDELLEMLNKYFEEYEKEEYINLENETYKKIQRYIINSIDINLLSIEDYDKIIEKVSKRPNKDIYFMNKFYKKVERNLCDNLKIDDDNLRKRYMFYLKEYRLIVDTLSITDFSGCLNFQINKDKWKIDYRGKVFINEQFAKQIRKLELLKKDNTYYKVNIKDINFLEIEKGINKLKEQLLERKEKLSTILKYIQFISDEVNLENNKVLKKV